MSQFDQKVLTDLGKKIAKVDHLIVGALRKRIELSLKVGAYKQEHDKPIYRGDIEDERVRDIQVWAKENGLNPHFVHSILYLVIDESCKNQMIQLQKDPEDLAQMGNCCICFRCYTDAVGWHC